MFKWIQAVALAVLVGSLVSVPAYAQGKGCQPLQLLLQSTLNVPVHLPPDVPAPPDWVPAPPPSDVIAWGYSGIIRGYLGTDPVIGTLYYLPPDPGTTPIETIVTGQTGHEGGRAVFDLGATGKFVTEMDTAVFQLSPKISPHPTYPPPMAWGHYSATMKIDPDYAFFGFTASGATGNVSMSGIFVVNNPTVMPPPIVGDTLMLLGLGMWNAEINGKICK